MLLPAFLAVLLSVAACRRGTLAPEPLPVDRVSCARCGMVVSDLSTAAQAVSRGEETRFYDDIGCLAEDRAVAGGTWRFFVHAGTAPDAWLPAESAFFARGAGATPMNYGIRAYVFSAQAAQSDGEHRARRWADVTAGERAAR
jgi:hypothetical protein